MSAALSAGVGAGQPTAPGNPPTPSASDNKELFALVLQLQSSNTDTVRQIFHSRHNFLLALTNIFREKMLFTNSVRKGNHFLIWLQYCGILLEPLQRYFKKSSVSIQCSLLQLSLHKPVIVCVMH